MHEELFAAQRASGSLRGRVVVTGYVPERDLGALYSGARAFVFPSSYEGFGLPPLEAMQCGTPVVASNATAIPEVVGDAGILVDPSDDDGLCQAMRDLLTDDALREGASRRGLARAERFSWVSSAAKTLEAYWTAVGGR
jgi:glycosyltransferase involved in cell wall biosynthesis